jgi:hypothetical protein
MLRGVVAPGREGSGAGEEEGRRGAAATRPAASRPAAVARDPLAEERRLLTAAREALERRDAAAMIQHITTHARRFPGGQLTAMRKELLGQALALGALRSARGAKGAQ